MNLPEGGKVLIPLLYHRILDVNKTELNGRLKQMLSWNFVSPDEFKCQVAWLVDNDLVLKVGHGNQLQRSPKVVLTFDDGYIDSFSTIAPILESFGVIGSYFLVSGYLSGTHRPWWERLAMSLDDWASNQRFKNTSSWWNKVDKDRFKSDPKTAWNQIVKSVLSLKNPNFESFLSECNISEYSGDRPSDLMGWKEAQLLSQMSHARIGYHSHSHLNLAKHSSTALREDFSLGVAEFANFGVNLDAGCAYPYGRFTKEVVNVTREVGFKSAYTASWWPAFGYSSTYTHPRLYVGPNHDAAILARRISRAATLLRCTPRVHKRP